LALVIIAAGAWFDWSYRSIRTEIAELQARLPSETALDQMPFEEGAMKIKTAQADCERVADLQANWIVKAFKAEAIAPLAQQCESIEARVESLDGH
jgi:hypothetical protein